MDSETIALITGVIGAITGIGGLIMGGLSLHQTKKLKSQDLRMERSRLINNIDIAIIKAKNLLEEANQSKIFRFARQGISKSSVSENWIEKVEYYKMLINGFSHDQFSIISSAEFKTSSIDYQIQQLNLIEQKINLIIEELDRHIADDKAAKN